MANTELVAAFARNQSKADSFSHKYGCTGYSDLNAFLAHPEMKIVTIGSVSGVHLEHVSAAAQAGKHIICEKPLEITPERIDKMIEICERNQVMLSGIFPRRFNDSTRIFKNALDAQRDSENWFFAILQLSGGGPRNITIAEHGVALGIWMEGVH